MKLALPAAVVMAATLALSACGSDDNSSTPQASTSGGTCPGGTLAGSGSTFQKNIELQWIKDFTATCPGATVDYKGTGSGAGIAQFGEGTVDFAGSDSVMKDDEQAKADSRCGTGNKALHLPVTAGAVVLTYNLKNVASLQLSPATIAGIFQGTIKAWDDAAVKADNPGTALPSTAIQAVHRADSSGTTDVFSKFLDKTAPGVWKLGAGKELSWPGGQSAKGSDGVTSAVKTSAAGGGITYTELSFAKSNNLPVAKVKNTSGAYVDATGDSVATALAAATVDESKGDLRVKVDFATAEPAAYPISAVSYVIACDKGNKNAALLKAYLTYATTTGQSVADSLGYAPVPSAIAAKLTATVTALA
ncbi:MAG: phosphate transport system substrate-binding protein [Frankiaceae bacterium]|nr:phosphate transport system substrate-binding protein [Frankiaceae bacterium]